MRPKKPVGLSMNKSLRVSMGGSTALRPKPQPGGGLQDAPALQP
jgi:hypothetical protein